LQPKSDSVIFLSEMDGAPYVNRRSFLALAGIGALGISAIPFTAQATPQETQSKIDSIAGGRPINDGRVDITLPEIAENGGTVPVSVAVNSPMSESDFVKTIHIFADDNPLPDVASYYFGPHNGKAALSMRIRLGKTQKVIALAETNNGELYIGRKEIKVTLGGCGG